jgi:hypothetical protein
MAKRDREKKLIRKRFYNEMLPKIKTKYKVIEFYGDKNEKFISFVKIFIDDKAYDYYPGAQKLKRCGGTPRKEDWKEVCIDTLYNKLMSRS